MSRCPAHDPGLGKWPMLALFRRNDFGPTRSKVEDRIDRERPLVVAREAVVEGSVAAVVAELRADLEVLAVGVVGERGDDQADGRLPERLGDAGRVALFVAVELGAAGEAE